jgi:hypothetical protein
MTTVHPTANAGATFHALNIGYTSAEWEVMAHAPHLDGIVPWNSVGDYEKGDVLCRNV